MKYRIIQHTAACMALGVLGVACSSTGGSTPDADGDATILTTATVVPTSTLESSESPTAEVVADTVVVVVDPAPIISDLPLLELIAPLDTTTELAPEFSWKPVDGAATYRLAVVGIGGPAWSWEGNATFVRLGGFSEDRPPGFPGPVIDQSTTWSVVALAADGAVIATSDVRKLAPS